MISTVGLLHANYKWNALVLVTSFGHINDSVNVSQFVPFYGTCTETKVSNKQFHHCYSTLFKIQRNVFEEVYFQRCSILLENMTLFTLIRCQIKSKFIFYINPDNLVQSIGKKGKFMVMVCSRDAFVLLYSLR